MQLDKRVLIILRVLVESQIFWVLGVPPNCGGHQDKKTAVTMLQELHNMCMCHDQVASLS